MKKFAMLSLFAMSAFAASWTGYISDAGCGAKHGPGKENAGCVKGCIAKGGSPVLVTADGKVIKIHNADAVGEKFYGKAVTITGNVTGDSVHVEKISE